MENACKNMKMAKLEAPDIKQLQWVFIRFEFLKIKAAGIEEGDLLFYVRSF